MNYKKNAANGLKRSMAFVLVLAMVLTSMGISGWGVGQASASTVDSYVHHIDGSPIASISAILNGIFEGNDYAQSYYDNDWALGMFAANRTPTEQELENYLKLVLNSVSGASLGTKAKTAIALATIGIDARYIPDKDSGQPINLIQSIMDSENPANWGGYNPILQASLALSLYDLGIYEIAPDAALTREALIEYILDSKGDDFWDDWGSTGQIGGVLLAFAPYYNMETTVRGITATSCMAITEAVNDTVVYLSLKMGEYGGFPGSSYAGGLDCNSQAEVLTGLHALGKDTHEGEFYKTASGLDNLLSYATSGNGFGWADNSIFNALASKEGTWALATYRNLLEGRSSNLYHFETGVNLYTNWPDAKLLTSIQVIPSKTIYQLNDTPIVVPDDLTVQAIYNGDYSTVTTVSITSKNITHSALTVAGAYTVTVNFMGEETTYTVSVTDAGGNIPAGKYISIKVIDDRGSIIASDPNMLIVEGETTALSALKELRGIIVVERGGYVSGINGLAEFSKGPKSGWKFRIGENIPGESAKEYPLVNGNRLEWYYITDYTKDSDSSKWKQEEVKSSEFIAKEDGKGSAVVGITKDDVAKLVKDGGALKAKSSLATIELDADTVKGLGKIMGKDLEIIAKKIDVSNHEGITQEMKDKIGDRPLLDLTVMSGGKQISNFDGKVTVSIPYNLKPGENPTTVVLYLLKDDGTMEMIKNATFDSKTGEVIFTTDHFSLYGIGHKDLLFSDIQGHWAKDYITYLAARDYITGMTKTSFDPNGSLTRGQFVQLLANLAGADLGKYGNVDSSGISDVKATDWFANAVAWAIEQGIVTGITMADGTTNFNPGQSISRQDIAVMLNRYRDKIDKKAFPEAVKEKPFQDEAQIGIYAKDAVKALQISGVIQGKSETVFAPLDQAKRGEAAKMIHGMLNLN